MSYIKNGRCANCGRPFRILPRTKTFRCLACYGEGRQLRDQTFTFSTWSERSAYLLGIFFSDGYLLDTDGRKRLGFSFKDRQLFDVVYRELGLRHTPKQIRSGSWRVQFGAPDLFDELVALGCPPRKSLVIQMPSVPPEHFGSFVRGYFDGDGSFVVRSETRLRTTPYLHPQLTFTSGSELFLHALSARAVEQCGIASRVVRGQSCWTLISAAIGSIESWYRLMYEGSSREMCCEAKRVRLESYFATVATRQKYTSRGSGQVISA